MSDEPYRHRLFHGHMSTRLSITAVQEWNMKIRRNVNQWWNRQNKPTRGKRRRTPNVRKQVGYTIGISLGLYISYSVTFLFTGCPRNFFSQFKATHSLQVSSNKIRLFFKNQNISDLLIDDKDQVKLKKSDLKIFQQSGVFLKYPVGE